MQYEKLQKIQVGPSCIIDCLTDRVHYNCEVVCAGVPQGTFVTPCTPQTYSTSHNVQKSLCRCALCELDGNVMPCGGKHHLPLKMRRTKKQKVISQNIKKLGAKFVLFILGGKNCQVLLICGVFQLPSVSFVGQQRYTLARFFVNVQETTLSQISFDIIQFLIKIHIKVVLQ